MSQRKIKELTHGKHTVKVFRDAHFNEYITKLYSNESRNAEATYFTADKEDAILTAHCMLDEAAHGFILYR